MSNTYNYQLLAELLSRLEAEGFTFGTAQYLKLQELLTKLPTDTAAEELKLLLTPAIAQSESEQQMIYDTFDAAKVFVDQLNAPLSNPESDEKKRNLWLPISIGIVAILAAWVALFMLRSETIIQEPISTSLTLEINTTTTLCLDDENLEHVKQPIERFHLKGDTAALSGESLHGKYELIKTPCLVYTASDSIGIDSVFATLVDANQITFDVIFNVHVIKTPQVEPEEEVEVAEVPTYFAYKPNNYNNDNDIYSLKLVPPSESQLWLQRNAPWLKLAFSLLLAGLLALILLYLAKRRRKLIAEVETSDKAPHTWSIELERKKELALGKDFGSMLTSFRQRTADDFVRLNIPKTIKATVANAGMINFQYQAQTRPSEYLMLIDRQTADDHRAQLYEHLFQQFKANEVYIERFFYDGDPRVCFNEAYPKGTNLNELLYRFGNARLIIVGSGSRLLRPTSGKLTKWAKIFEGWKNRALLSTRPLETWDKREQNLEQLFPIFPASLDGLRFLLEEFDAGEDADFSKWGDTVSDVEQEIIELEGALIPSLRVHFSEQQVRWIAACAIYPNLHWDLTLELADLLSTEQEQFLSFSQLNDLNRLSWFVEGTIPKQDRVTLVNWLAEKYPESLQQVRLHLHELLKQNPPPKDSAAWEDYQLNQNLNEWLITTDSQRKKELEQEIGKWLEAGTEPDITVVKHLDRPTSPLDFIVPESWKQQLYPGGYRGLGLKNIGKDLLWAIPLWALLTGLFTIFWQPEVNNCEGDVKTFIAAPSIYEFANSFWIPDTVEVCLESGADIMLYNEYLTRNAILTGQEELADSLITANKNNLDLSKGDHELSVAFQAFAANIGIDYYNIGVHYYLQSEEVEYLSTAWDTLHERACSYFFKAAEYNSEDDLIEELAWCNVGIEEDYPGAAFHVPEGTHCVPATLQFENLSFNVAPGSDRIEWDFGNGQSSSDFTPTVIFEETGVYEVKLYIKSSVGEAEITREVIIEDCRELQKEASPNRYMWCLDNGHAQNTLGKNSPVFELNGKQTQLFEYEFNRDINRRIMAKLAKAGVQYFNVVPELAEDVQLSERVRRANTLSTDLPKIYVSIHCNAGPTPPGKNWSLEEGVETWYYQASTTGKKIASIFQKYLLETTGLKNRGLKSTEQVALYVLRHAAMPAILVESGFLNNEEEVKKLMDSKVRQTIADAYVDAILNIEKYGLENLKEENVDLKPSKDQADEKTNISEEAINSSVNAAIRGFQFELRGIPLTETKTLSGGLKPFTTKIRKRYSWVIDVPITVSRDAMQVSVVNEKIKVEISEIGYGSNIRLRNKSSKVLDNIPLGKLNLDLEDKKFWQEAIGISRSKLNSLLKNNKSQIQAQIEEQLQSFVYEAREELPINELEITYVPTFNIVPAQTSQPPSTSNSKQ